MIFKLGISSYECRSELCFFKMVVSGNCCVVNCKLLLLFLNFSSAKCLAIETNHWHNLGAVERHVVESRNIIGIQWAAEYMAYRGGRFDSVLAFPDLKRLDGTPSSLCEMSSRLLQAKDFVQSRFPNN